MNTSEPSDAPSWRLEFPLIKSPFFDEFFRNPPPILKRLALPGKSRDADSPCSNA